MLILTTIVEPDLTNPTRHRWERPLDTIRGFEAAIYKDEYRGSYVGTYLPFSKAFWVKRNVSNAVHSSETIDTIPDGSWRHYNYPQQCP